MSDERRDLFYEATTELRATPDRWAAANDLNATVYVYVRDGQESDTTPGDIAEVVKIAEALPPDLVKIVCEWLVAAKESGRDTVMRGR